MERRRRPATSGPFSPGNPPAVNDDWQTWLESQLSTVPAFEAAFNRCFKEGQLDAAGIRLAAEWMAAHPGSGPPGSPSRRGQRRQRSRDHRRPIVESAAVELVPDRSQKRTFWHHIPRISLASCLHEESRWKPRHTPFYGEGCFPQAVKPVDREIGESRYLCHCD
jgi:hypothetical protein